MDTMHRRNNSNLIVPDPRLDNHFSACMVLNGITKPEEILRLFISFPHVGVGDLPSEPTRATKTLAEYTNLHCKDPIVIKPDPLEDAFFVDWTSFTVFDSGLFVEILYANLPG
jgi:hypothetical protein